MSELSNTPAEEISEISVSDSEQHIPPYFYFYTKYCPFFAVYTNEQAGEVIKSLCAYVQGEELPPNEFPMTKPLIDMMKNEIDHAFKRYRAQCENGKKGGAPKGNKNAAKKKQSEGSTPEESGGSLPICKTIPLDKTDAYIAYILSDCIYWEAGKEDFTIDDHLKKPQIADLAACYCISAIESFSEWECKYKTLRDYVLNESAAKACKEVKETAEYWYEGSDFSSKFAELKQRALALLKYPISEIRRYHERCDAYEYPEDYSDEDLKEYLTDEEYKDVKSRKDHNSAGNNPNST